MNGSLYRAWSTEYKKMFRVKELSQDRDGYLHGLVDVGLENEHYPTQEEYQKHPYIREGRVAFSERPKEVGVGHLGEYHDESFYLMGYSTLTGVTEKDFLYEGDIVTYEDEHGEQQLGEVVKVRGAYFFRSINNKEQKDILLSEVYD